MIPDERSALALAGTVAELIGGGGRGGDDARSGHRRAAERARAQSGCGSGSGPPAPSRSARCARRGRRCRREVASLEAVPREPDDARFVLEHAGIEVGLLEARIAVGERERETLRVICHILAPYLASLELSEDLAGEVVAQAREIEEHRRFTSLIIDSLPVGLYVVDRDYRIQIWNRKRETGTQGLRRDEVVGRPVFEVLTRQPPEQLSEEFDRVFQTGEIQQSEQEVTLRGRGPLLPAEQDPDAAGPRRDHPRDHDRRGRHRLARGAGPDHAVGEAGRGRAARRRDHARDQQPARHHRRLRRGDAGQAGGRPGDHGRTGRVPRHHRPRSGALQQDRGRAARFQPAEGAEQGAAVGAPRWWTRRCSCSSTTSASSG